MTHKNEVTLNFIDKTNYLGAIEVNGKLVQIAFVTIYKNKEDFNGKQGYSCQVCNDWNTSNPLTFTAPTIKGLIGQLKRYKYNLKPFKH